MPSPSQPYIIRKALWLVSGIILVSLMSIGASLWTVQSADGDAERINLAGSLRMYAMRIALAYRDYPGPSEPPGNPSPALATEISAFEARLHSPALRQTSLSASDDQKIKLNTLQANWQAIRQEIESHHYSPQAVEQVMRRFVADIDHFVTLIENHSKQKITRLQWIHGLGITSILFVAFLMVTQLSRRILHPLHLLMSAAQRAMQGDLHSRIHYNAPDEMGELIRAFNHMTEELEAMCLHLEQRVIEKTKALHRRNLALEFLNHATTRMAAHPNSKQAFLAVLQHACSVMNLDRIYLVYRKKTDAGPWTILSATTEQARESNESDPTLPADVLSDTLWEQIMRTNKPRTKKDFFILPIRQEGRFSGLLIAKFHHSRRGSAWQRHLMTALSEVIVQSINQSYIQRQEQRYVLLEERSAIARELHDSIAQSLSYLKLQMSRFDTLLKQTADRTRLEEVIGEIRTGLNQTYTQLREVIRSFRIKTNEPGLEQAIQSLLTELASRYPIQTEFKCYLPTYQPGLNEEIHLLQIVREALSNASRHAEASRVTVELLEGEDHRIQVSVCDNGKGIHSDRDPGDHHGIAIMQERAKLLGGTLEIGSPHADGQSGTCVRLTFCKQSDNPDEFVSFGGL